MSKDRVSLVVILLACIGAALSIWIVGSLDKQGTPHMGADPVIAALLLLPYLIIAAVAVWNRDRAIVIAACLLTVIAIAALALPRAWSDHQAWQREPSGREVQHYGFLAVLVVEWAGSGLLLALAVAHRLISMSRKRKDEIK